MDEKSSEQEILPPETGTPAEPQRNMVAVPLAIVVAGALVAFAIYSRPVAPGGGGANVLAVPNAEPMRPVDSKDHIFGNPAARVFIIEYSDLECPFCKRFHPTLQEAINEYGKDGQVAWVYRHFPIDSLHPKARKEAEAAECAAKLGGNEKFWAYIGRIFEVTPSNNQLDEAFLPQIAEDLGLPRSEFETCLASGEMASRVADDLKDAMNAGAQGTPYSLVVAKNGRRYPINGAQPYAVVKEAIEAALREQ